MIGIIAILPAKVNSKSKILHLNCPYAIEPITAGSYYAIGTIVL
jgi:hypothetical protein